MRHLLKDSTIYLIGEIISKIIPFLLIPYLSRKLGVAGYGELSYYQTYTALFVILFGLAQEGSVTRYFYFYGKNALDLIVRTGYLYTICIASLSFLICLFFKSEILLYLVLAAVFEVFVTVQLSIRQCQKQALPYVVIQILSGVLSLSITIFLLEFFQTNLVEKRILAILTSNALVFVISYFFLYRTKVKKRKFSINKYTLLILAENAVKHSMDALAPSYIYIQCEAKEGFLLFSVRNSVPSQPNPKHKCSGIGLPNLSRRLELLYGEHFSLSQERLPQEYIVTLALPL